MRQSRRGRGERRQRRHEPLESHRTDAQPSTGGAEHYTLFEAGAVRPVAVLPSGMVAVTNIPDDRVELFRPLGHGVRHCGSVKVGLRPVAVSVVGSKLWVVNHLSDTVSVVDVNELTCSAEVERTLLVGDEPRDVVSTRTASGQRLRLRHGRSPRAERQRRRRQSARSEALDAGDGQGGRVRLPLRRPRCARRGKAGHRSHALHRFASRARGRNGKVYAAGYFSGNQTSLVRYQLVVDRGRQSLAKLDANADMQIDPELPPEARVIEGGYPAIHGHGRCVNATLSTPNTPGADRNDFWMDTCVQTDPGDPYHAIKIFPQNTGVVTPECSCNDSGGEMQITGPMIVRFFDSQAVCGANYRASLGGCWLEPPQDNAELPGPGATSPLLVQAWNDQVALSLPDKTCSPSTSARTRRHSFPRASSGTWGRRSSAWPFTEERKGLRRQHRRAKPGPLRRPGLGISQSDGFANSTVRGHVAESRITVLDPASAG